MIPGDSVALTRDVSSLSVGWESINDRPAGTFAEYIEHMPNKSARIGLRGSGVCFVVPVAWLRPLSPLERLAEAAE